MAKNEDKWMANYEALKAHVLETGHFCDKHTRLCNWLKFQRKRIKAGTMPEEQMRLFLGVRRYEVGRARGQKAKS